jgi:hypothetical protein
MAHAQAQPGFDPRKIITPESFHVAPHLLGLPLASPTRRLAAILLDLLLVSVVANVGGKIVFALAAAGAFFWFAGKRLGKHGGFFSHTARLAFRVVGTLMLFVAALWVWKGARTTVDRVVEDDAGGPAAAASAAPGAKRGLSAGALLRGGLTLRALATAHDSAAARAAAEAGVRQMRGMQMSNADLRLSLVEAVKDRPPAVKAGVRAALPPADTLPTAAPSAGDSADAAGADTAEEEAKPDTVPTNPDSLAAAYVAAVRGGDAGRADALRPKLASTLARDSLAELRGRVGQLEGENAELERDKKQAEGRGLLATLLEWLDDLGIGFGWTGLYFTAFTAMFRGQTPGKKLFGIRVLRLDGEPMTLWASFERFGGYAAGLFTGLMGYMQVYWDRNRQAIQDKISETVVIRDRGQPLPVAAGRPGAPPAQPYSPQPRQPPFGPPPFGQPSPTPPPPYPPRPPAGVGSP